MSGLPLRVEGLHFAYGKNKVLRGVDFCLSAGQITVLLGANGAGKSTLFRCLVGLLKPSRGTVLLGESNVLKLDVTQRLRRVCYIPQAFAVSARLTVFETVLLAREQAAPREERRQALSKVEHVLALTGLTELSQANLNELSGGQQQRVGTAQALSQDPEALLMDEPTSALDLRYQLETLELIQRFTRERSVTTFVALHDINLAARFADSILLLEGGRVALHDSPATALTSAELEHAYSVQLEGTQTPSGISLVAAKLRAVGQVESKKM